MGDPQWAATRKSPVTGPESRHDMDRSLCCSALRLPAEFPHAVAPERVEPPRSPTERLKQQSNACGVPFLECGRYGTICASDGYLMSFGPPQQVSTFESPQRLCVKYPCFQHRSVPHVRTPTFLALTWSDSAHISRKCSPLTHI